MVKQSSGSTNKQTDSFLQSDTLSSSVHTSNQQSDGFVVEMTYFFGYFINLNSQLSCGSNHYNPSPILLLEFESSQKLEAGDKICQCLS